MKYSKKGMIGLIVLKAFNFRFLPASSSPLQRIIPVIYVLNYILFEITFELIIKVCFDGFENRVLPLWSHLGIVVLKGIWTEITLFLEFTGKCHIQRQVSIPDTKISTLDFSMRQD